MSVSQQLFVVFFAIFWGTSANAWPLRKPFHWPLVGYAPVRNRLALSIVLLNAIPVVYFWWMFQVLAGRSDVVIAVLPAFSVFGFYRVWLAATEWRSDLFYFATPPAEIAAIEPKFEVMPDYIKKLNLAFGLGYVVVATLPVFCR